MGASSRENVASSSRYGVCGPEMDEDYGERRPNREEMQLQEEERHRPVITDWVKMDSR